jgi:hypothetical protein
VVRDLHRVAAEALAVHHEHRARDVVGARELALLALEDAGERHVEDVRYRVSRLDRKLARAEKRQLFV